VIFFHPPLHLIFYFIYFHLVEGSPKGYKFEAHLHLWEEGPSCVCHLCHGHIRLSAPFPCPQLLWQIVLPLTIPVCLFIETNSFWTNSFPSQATTVQTQQWIGWKNWVPSPVAPLLLTPLVLIGSKCHGFPHSNMFMQPLPNLPLWHLATCSLSRRQRRPESPFGLGNSPGSAWFSTDDLKPFCTRHSASFRNTEMSSRLTVTARWEKPGPYTVTREPGDAQPKLEVKERFLGELRPALGPEGWVSTVQGRKLCVMLTSPPHYSLKH
jgi:hypothetical protein